MDSLELKSTGFLCDELCTTQMKLDAGNSEAIERRHKLGNIVMSRMLSIADDMEKHRQYQSAYKALCDVLRQLWDSEEKITSFPDVSECSIHQLYQLAGIAQHSRKLNARRTDLMREIDIIVGEQERAPLRKTYAERI